jgi:hypothetical protein
MLADERKLRKAIQHHPRAIHHKTKIFLCEGFASACKKITKA